MSPQLTVYKASAGSGKTFTLAIEYIKLLIENPTQYKNILAVTFTNKATEEMKHRILSQLYGIAHQLPDSEIYIKRVVDDMGITRQTAAARAQTALTLLIHDYSQFRIMTIDTFFQGILRNLARELDLTANLRIGLNDGQVEEQAVDQLLEQLTHSDRMLGWIISYIEQKMSDDKSWNVIGQIKQFGKTIFSDNYKKKSRLLNERLQQDGLFEDYVESLQAVRTRSRQRMSHYSETFHQALTTNGLTVESLKSGQRGIASYFAKIASNDFSDKKTMTKTLEKCLQSADEWVAKSSKEREIILPLVNDVLLPLLQQAELERPRQWKLLVSAEQTLRHLNQLRLLSSIEQKVRQLNNEANRFLLSDTQGLLNRLIDNTDSPFIFEKTGSQLTHIMIDEFQDTSTVQWENFKILLEETMSHSDEGGKTIEEREAGSGERTIRNLIVGDVKQSIYRWRSGDWRLLNNIEEAFKQGQTIEVQPLKVNRRSCRNIVTFNNAFFQLAALKEYEHEKEIIPDQADQLKTAYGEVLQEVPEDKPKEGLVDIRLLPGDSYDEETLRIVGERVDNLLAAGIKPSNIAILVRKNKYIPLLADFFTVTRPQVSIISDEAFRLDASLAVNTMVNVLHMLTDPKDNISRENATKAWHTVALPDDTPPPALSTTAYDDYLNMPLYNLCERIFREWKLDRLSQESGYVCKFFDELTTFIQDNGADIDGLLKTWDEDLCRKYIQSSEPEGIRLISIHKSKGLEFDNVIIPWCDWKLEMTDTLWCETDSFEPPFNKLPIVPVDYSSRLSDSIYHDEYAQEHLQTCVDNLNLLYVAFTRAGSNLFIIGKRNASGQRSQLIQECLKETEEALKDATLSFPDNQQEPIVFEYGELSLTAKTKKQESDNIFDQPIVRDNLSIQAHEPRVAFRQSNQSREFIADITDEAQNASDEQENTAAAVWNDSVAYVKMGNIMHRIFSQIRTIDDIPKMLRKLEHDGVVYDESISRKKVESILKGRFSNPTIKRWFSDEWQLFNECSIIAVDTEGRLLKRRPDRVMYNGQEVIVVDFKFGSERTEYHDQVREYMQLLNSMGYPHVRGYLWFVYSNTIQEVRSSL